MDPALKPMLATAGKAFPHIGNWTLEPKLDGWRYVAFNDEHGDLHCYGGRNGSEYTGQLPYLEEQLADMLPPGTAVDGELIGEEWGDVQGWMTRNAPLNGETPLEMVVFDIPRLCLRDIRNATQPQRTAALDVFEWDDYPHISRMEALEATAAMHTKVIDEGYEGSVWKSDLATYSSGRRSPMWLKFKAERTDEARVTGFKAGDGEFKGMIGAIEFEFLGNGVASRASGMDLETRKDMTDNPANWIGAIIEVKHNGFMKSGKARHPQYLRRRDDRMPRVVRPARPRAQARSNRGVSVQVAGASKRNYGAMGDDKLRLSIASLMNSRGDAWQRCVDAGCDPQADLKKARAIAATRGLDV